MSCSPASHATMTLSRRMPSAVRPSRDLFKPGGRSELMARISGKGNKSTELVLATELMKRKITGWRRHVDLPGRPDFTFQREKLCIFVHGCFWHGCPRCYRAPSTNVLFWKKKVIGNQRRDRRVSKALRRSGYMVVTIWECQLRGASRPRALRRIPSALGRRSRMVALGPNSSR